MKTEHTPIDHTYPCIDCATNYAALTERVRVLEEALAKTIPYLERNRMKPTKYSQPYYCFDWIIESAADNCHCDLCVARAALKEKD
jgi:hypothetical protein